MSTELPQGWTETSLGQLANYVNGKAFNKLHWKEQGLPIIRIQNLNNPNAPFNYSDEVHEERYKVQKDDLLIAWSASLGAYIWKGDDAWLNQHIFRVEPYLGIVHTRYLYYAVTNSIDELYKKSHGMGMVHVTKGKFEGHGVWLPPLNEQIRIADKLDSVFAKVDAAQARLEKIPTLLKRFRQSVLAAATSGELTREWRIANSEINAVAELQRLEKIKASLIGEKLVKKDLFFSVSEELETPSNWGEVKLGSLSSKITDGEHSTPKRESEGYYLLSARNVRDGAVSLEKVDYVGEEEFIKLRKRCDPNKGDILISCSGSVGRVALCDRSDAYVMVRSAALVKTDHMNQNNRFLMYVLQSPVLQEIIVEKSKATAQANLFLEPIKELPIPYPPKEEQKEIVRRVESLFTLADTVEKQYLAAKQRLDRLTQSLLAKAFRGELVPQDPNDEPAAELLKRIQAERNAQPPVKNKRAKSA